MTRAYLIKLSNGVDIPIDEDEIEKATQAIERGAIGKMRKGIFNPSFIVAIIEDKERIKRFYEEVNRAEKHNELYAHDPTRQRIVPIGFKKLQDIFAKKQTQITQHQNELPPTTE